MKKLLENKIFQIGLMAFGVIAAGILFYFFLENINVIWGLISKLLKILTPLIYGLVLAYIMHPIVKLFENKVFNKIKKENVKRNLSIFVTFVIIIGILAAIISIIIPQVLLSIQSLVTNIPDYLKSTEVAIKDWLRGNKELSSQVLANYDVIAKYVVDSFNNVISPMANSALEKFGAGIWGIISFLFNLAIGMVFAVYILANNKKFGLGFKKLTYSLWKKERAEKIIKNTEHVNHVFLQFLVGKVCDSFCFVFTMTLLFLIIFRYPYALLIAVIIALTDLIPYFGPYIGTIPSALLIFLVNPIKALTFIIFILVLQQIDGNLVTPRIQKQATGLPSFWVLFAITLFGGLFGIVGLLIAVPCFTIIYEVIKTHINNRLEKKKIVINEVEKVE